MSFMPRTVFAPFTDAQVEALNRFQDSDFHAYTCGNENHLAGERPKLIAANAGWVCPDPECTYSQSWATLASIEEGTRYTSDPYKKF